MARDLTGNLIWTISQVAVPGCNITSIHFQRQRELSNLFYYWQLKTGTLASWSDPEQMATSLSRSCNARNFSSDMMVRVLENEHFSELRRRRGSQLLVRHIFCPLISCRSNLLPGTAHNALRAADFVYVKGLNFFETCQIRSKDTYHAFVMLGPISQLYTGLQDYDAVFAHVLSGVMGYTHDRDSSRIRTLVSACTPRPLRPALTVGLDTGAPQAEDLGTPRSVQP